MTAFAGAAQAQSSVTVYGILDVGFINSNYSGTSPGTANTANISNATQQGAANIKQTTTGFGQSAESTSRLGFKGSEDLGGGTSAIFTVEMALAPDNQSSTTVAAGNLSFNRQSFVGLKKSGLGQATIGTQYTPIFDAMSTSDAAGMNNLIGNAVYSGNLQSSTGTFNYGVGAYGGQVANQSLNAYTGAYTTRTSNALKLQSDRFSGFQGQLFYAQANNNATSTGAGFSGATTSVGGSNNNTAWGLNGDYVWNKLNVVAAYQNVKSYDPSVPTAVALTQGAATPTISNGSAGNFGTNTTDSQVYAGVNYDFGILKAYYQFISRKASYVADSSYYTKRQANQIGVRSQLTPTISAYATYGLTNAAYFGQGLAPANGRTYQVGVDYYLSKRTNLYVAGGAANQSSNGSTNNATVPAAAAAGGVGTSASNYAVGIRHTF